MAPWSDSARPSTPDKRTEDPRREAWDEENPFIAFRRFADEQFHTLAQGFNAIPDMLSEMRYRADEQRQQWEQRNDQSSWAGDTREQETGRRRGPWADSLVPPPRTPSEEGLEAARALLIQARNANTGVDPKKILALYRDGNRFGLDSMPSSIFQPQWLSVDWFKRSPYSPAQIETHRHAHQHGSMWRAAFEDLLAAELGKEQEAHAAWTGRVNNQRLYATWAQTPTDWMLGLQCRGILPPQLPAMYQLHRTQHMDQVFSNIVSGRWSRDRNPLQDSVGMADFEHLAHEISTFDEDERNDQAAGLPQTELDAYEQLLSRSSAPAKSSTLRLEPSGSGKADAVSSPSNLTTSKVLSTLSTTERTTLPDGTVTTKIVLKKRFADGREESTETVTTSHAEQQRCPDPLAAEIKQAAWQYGEQSTKKDDKDEKKKGWFWS